MNRLPGLTLPFQRHLTHIIDVAIFLADPSRCTYGHIIQAASKAVGLDLEPWANELLLLIEERRGVILADDAYKFINPNAGAYDDAASRAAAARLGDRWLAARANSDEMLLFDDDVEQAGKNLRRMEKWLAGLPEAGAGDGDGNGYARTAGCAVAGGGGGGGHAPAKKKHKAGARADGKKTKRDGSCSCASCVVAPAAAAAQKKTRSRGLRRRDVLLLYLNT